MRELYLTSALVGCALLAACGNSQPASTSRQNSNSASNLAPSEGGSGGANANGVGVVSSHGGGAAAPSGSSSGSDLKPPVETPELDAKIKGAEAKAKAAGAGDADKKAAAAAYFARADFFRDKGMPVLYKFALADYRRGLRYDPTNKDARDKMDEIVQIYQSMGRPVPELGNEQ
jgi:hypothetical protein